MIFLTVGTQFGFDRLCKAIDDSIAKGLINQEVFGQIGQGNYSPQHFKWCRSLEKDEFDSIFKNADAIISHAGMGTITMALEYGKPLLVIPRLAKYREVVNDHQVGLANKFQELGHLLLAENVDILPEKIDQLKTFILKQRESQAVKVSERIKHFITLSQS